MIDIHLGVPTLEDWRAHLVSANAIGAVTARMEDLLVDALRDRALFQTENGYIGICSPDVIIGKQEVGLHQCELG
jgi:hypothetical protein